MNTSIWQEITAELHAGTHKKTHPFRYGTLATVGLETLPRQRTIVLRAFDPEEMRISFYTDTRSKKILHLKENNRVSLLLFNPGKQLQVRIEGLAHRERSESVLQECWARLQAGARRDYTSLQSPGTEITDPHRIDYMQKETSDFFGIVHIFPFKIEYLKLVKPDHLRVRFSKEKQAWNSEYLVP
ncbi:pyridoxamine 5'-phosphate oxidase family protein [Robiginitalea sp. M366]|uniref:pyridoxamine 5'-phosphate oxidase family protein n=1 Tax=Robiginitalea aestuariiviva TaxID=3036903 RepID=UPI00240DEAF9|nr:pyridoxamine 5'-phosphate oxidase family protein [Robiginitalea aestuariiviva]MDG1572549.1 pyridoxamine 5'-phosphate oxidase family protein [Robiginitalea aestuariiviva]